MECRILPMNTMCFTTDYVGEATTSQGLRALSNREDKQGPTVLHSAVLNGDEDLALRLIERYEACVFSEVPGRHSVIDLAIEHGLHNSVTILLGKGLLNPDQLSIDQLRMLRIPACDGDFPELISAVMAGRVELVRSLCFAGVAHIQDSDGLTALWHASRSGLSEMVEVLLETGPFNDARELCVTNLNGRTSLIVRVLSGNLILVRSLLKTSLVAQVMIPDKNGWLPCEHAVFWSHALGRDDVAKRMVTSLNEAAIQ
jgi:ankyrin repeat protein